MREISCHNLLGIFLFGVLFSITSSTNDWKPILSPSTFYDNKRLVEDRYGFPGSLAQYDHSLIGPNSIIPGLHQKDQCALTKVSFNQENYYQYVEYMQKIPDLKEFTICMWVKFHNHSTDHQLFSYAVGDQPKEIVSWVSNTERASYISMAVAGRTFYRLNYPFKLMRWYHSCQSWNGKTGEWQLWIDNERTGRGFYNRLVGHVIKGGGSAISGQSHSQLSGQNENDNFKQFRSVGMVGQITMLQLYFVALTAGKAHKDHKHHHVHHFDHNGAPLEVTTPAPTTPDPSNGLLPGRQLPYMLNLNLGNTALVQSQLNNGIQYSASFTNGQFNPSRTISEQLLTEQLRNRNGPVAFTTQGSQIVFPTPQIPPAPSSNPFFLGGETATPANIQFLDFPIGARLLQKRDDKEVKDKQPAREKRDNKAKEMEKEIISQSEGGDNSKKPVKRGLIILPDGTLADDGLIGDAFDQSLLNGLAGLGENVQIQNIQKEQSDEREPAEAEVIEVLNMCSGCAEEPFQKALILSWRHTPLKLFRGSKLLYAIPSCRSF